MQVHVPTKPTAVSACVPRATKRKLYALAQQQGQTPSALIRVILEAYLKQQENGSR